MNWLASKHNLKMAGRSFGWKKNYGLTVTVSSEPWCPVKLRLIEATSFVERLERSFATIKAKDSDIFLHS